MNAYLFIFMHIFADKGRKRSYIWDMKKVAVAGARGYSGLELTRILSQHPKVELAGLYASVDFDPADSWPELTIKCPGLPLSHLLESKDHLDCVFLALPHEASAEIAPKLLSKGCDVVDLSGAFRLQDGTQTEQTQAYEHWYRMKHPALNWLSQAQYGLVPFQRVKATESASLIANPGCYATAISLALIPLLKNNLIKPDFVAIDAKSGTTGAGKKAEERLLFSEVSDNCLPYKVNSHQHEPEIQMALQRWGNSQIEMSFTPHLLPTRRGIIATIYGQVPMGTMDSHLQSAYHDAFGSYPFARFGNLNEKNMERELRLNRVVGSPRAHIVWKLSGQRLTVFALIDNLLKGAASQAVENMNLLYGWDVQSGLTLKEGLL